MNFSGLAGRLTRYGTVGILANLVGYGLFLALLFVGLPAVIASGITYLVMVAASYLANRHWTFRSASSHASDMPRYLAAYGVGFVTAMGAMYLLAALMHPALAQIVVTGLAAVVIYTGLELLHFGRLESGDAD